MLPLLIERLPALSALPLLLIIFRHRHDAIFFFIAARFRFAIRLFCFPHYAYASICRRRAALFYFRFSIRLPRAAVAAAVMPMPFYARACCYLLVMLFRSELARFARHLRRPPLFCHYIIIAAEEPPAPAPRAMFAAAHAARAPPRPRCLRHADATPAITLLLRAARALCLRLIIIFLLLMPFRRRHSPPLPATADAAIFADCHYFIFAIDICRRFHCR